MLTDDAAALLQTEHFHILSQVMKENNGVFQKGVSSASVCMPYSNGTGTMVSAENLDIAQNGEFNENLNGALENALLTVPTSSKFFELSGFGTKNILELKSSNCNNKNSLQDAVE
eukprot:13138754-Ditylum_brightwellii.AAC.1